MKCSFQVACTPSADIPTKAQFGKVLALLSKAFELTTQSLTLRIVDTEESRTLNKTYRGKDKPTNVLSFPFNESNHLGDLVLCHTVIAKEAIEQSKTLKDHYTHLVVHGILHLLGYDHENIEDAQEMEALEIDLLNELHINNPYEEQHHGA